MMSSERLALLAAAALALLQIGSGQSPSSFRRFEFVEPHMGTLVQIKLYARNQQQAQSAARQAFDRIAALDDILSDYKPASELNRLCRLAGGGPVRVSADLFLVLAAAQHLAQQTDGAFDITVGPLSHLWRDARQSDRLPDPKSLQQAVTRCGYRKLSLDAAKRTVRLAQPGMQLDVGAIGKGYAADEAIAILRGLHIQSALVSVSGDLAFSSAPPGEPGWRIGIDSFSPTGEALEKTLLLKNGAASTSGDSEQHLDVGNTRYSHIINPHTGAALTQPITVTVIARKGIDADPQATAICVLGLDRGLRFVEHSTDSAALIATKSSNFAELRESSRFKILAAH